MAEINLRQLNIKVWSSADEDSKKFINPYNNKQSESLAVIPESFLESLSMNYKTTTLKYLAILCKAKCFVYPTPCNDKNHPMYGKLEKYKKSALYFFLTWDDVHTRYGLYQGNSKSCFYHDMQRLIDAGFIERYYKGTGRTKTVYKLSDKWKDNPVEVAMMK